GCQNEPVVRTKGYGMPKFKSDGRGDLFTHVNVEVPKKLSKRERELLEELAAEMGEDVAEARTPFQKLKDSFF
ncbi:MAG: molecular chaperone DnaJ, partial [Eggerthellaceae bacterium]|nr:molecular chaperone DnaJ [Eggerthellaceae bacterium]